MHVSNMTSMNKPGSNIEDQLLLKYILKGVTKEECDVVEAWLKEGERNVSHLEKLKTTWQLAGALETFSKIDVDRNWAATKSRLGIDQPERKQRFLLPNIWRYAATILLLAAITFLVVRLADQKPEMLNITANRDATELELPDGTKVWLMAGTQLSYPATFSSGQRLIELNGEGFFEVVHNEDKPFIVQTSLTKTEVLGTSFNLRGYKDEHTSELVLVSGKVRFSSSEEELILAPGEKVVMQEDGKLAKSMNTDLNFMAWKNRTLIFENTRMEQVVKDITKLYKIQLNIQDAPLKTCPLTTRFENESLEDILETIKLLFGVEISQNGNVYTIAGGGC